MKKFLSYVSIAALAVCVLSCGGNKKAKQVEAEAPAEKSMVEQQQEEYIKMQIDSLSAEMLRLKPLDFVKKTNDGSISLTDKEKQVKPEYLVSASAINDLQTLSQKYRAAAIR